MKKSSLLCIAVSGLIMIFLPWLAVTFAGGDAGMAVCFLLFFVVDPLYFLGLGILSGRDGGSMWWQPVLAACLFVLGTWIFFDPGERAFLYYAGVYLVLGITALLISASVNAIKRRAEAAQR